MTVLSQAHNDAYCHAAVIANCHRLRITLLKDRRQKKTESFRYTPCCQRERIHTPAYLHAFIERFPKCVLCHGRQAHLTILAVACTALHYTQGLNAKYKCSQQALVPLLPDIGNIGGVQSLQHRKVKYVQSISHVSCYAACNHMDASFQCDRECMVNCCQF